MPENLPALTAPTYMRYTFRYVDFRGDKKAVSLVADVGDFVPGVDNANVQTLATALGALSNANLYELQITEIYADEPLASLAENEVFALTDDLIRVNMKKGLQQQTWYVPAPEGSVIVSGESVDYDDAGALWTGMANALGTFMPTWTVLTAGFSEHVDRNPSTPVT